VQGPELQLPEDPAELALDEDPSENLFAEFEVDAMADDGMGSRLQIHKWDL
jgi:hypothetical protein